VFSKTFTIETNCNFTSALFDARILRSNPFLGCVKLHILQLKVVKLLITMAFGFILMAGLLVGVEHDLNTRRTILGVLCATLATLMYAAPLTIMVRVSSRAQTPEFQHDLLKSSVLIQTNGFKWYTNVMD